MKVYYLFMRAKNVGFLPLQRTALSKIEKNLDRKDKNQLETEAQPNLNGSDVNIIPAIFCSREDE